ncbi:hypothetical protein Lal_00033079 [Lupinus albus]|nr:hypothetical protein Lal_00033079 [Lupinus albus]
MTATGSRLEIRIKIYDSHNLKKNYRNIVLNKQTLKIAKQLRHKAHSTNLKREKRGFRGDRGIWVSRLPPFNQLPLDLDRRLRTPPELLMGEPPRKAVRDGPWNMRRRLAALARLGGEEPRCTMIECGLYLSHKRGVWAECGGNFLLNIIGCS